MARSSSSGRDRSGHTAPSAQQLGAAQPRPKRRWPYGVLALLVAAALATLVPSGTAAGQTGDLCVPPPTTTRPADTPAHIDFRTDKIRLHLSIAGPLPEADRTFTIDVTAKLNGWPLAHETTVTLSIADTSTATAGEDYETPTLPTITIECGNKQATGSFDLTVKDDNAFEPFYERIVIDGTHDAGDHIDMDSDFLLIQDGIDGAPESILDLAATIGDKSNTVRLTWSVPDSRNPADPPNHYVILRYSAVDNENGARIEVDADDACVDGTCTYEDAGLAFSTDYRYTVSAGNNSGWSTSRVIAAITTGSAPPQSASSNSSPGGL